MKPWVVLLGWAALIVGALRAQSEDPAREVTTAAAVRALSPADISRQPPVRLRGVITFHEPETGLTYLQDETAGLGLAAGTPSRLPADLRVGTRVEVAGVASQGNYAPVVAGPEGGAPAVRVLGEADLPAPLPIGVGDLLGGALDGSWVELRGTVRSVQVRPFSPETEADREMAVPESARPQTRRLSLELGTEAGRFVVIVPWREGGEPPTELLDARIVARGVLGSIVNRRRQWVGLLLYVPSLTQVTVERPPSSDPFALPVRPVDEVLRFAAGSTGEDRVRVRGVVTLVQPGYRLYLRSARGPLEVQTSLPLDEIKPGVEVDVVGYPIQSAKRVLLQDSRVRVLSRREPPLPQDMSRSEVMAQYADSELVRMTGSLYQNALRGESRVLVLEADGGVIEARFARSLDKTDDAKVGLLRPGTELELTGIAQVSGAADWGGGVRPYALSLLLRDRADLVVRQEPPWWTAGRLAAVVGALALIVLAGAGWVVGLRRRVAAQTEIIREQARREANERERRRIAQDIHDDLGSRLTQLALLGARVKAAAGADAATGELGERISATARTTVQTMDEIVWAINPGNDTLQSLGDYLCKVATALLTGAEIPCQLDVPAVLPEVRLSAEHRHNLVLSVREALHNVVKHSRAKEAGLSLRWAEGMLEIEVWDRGVGFAPDGAGRGNGHGNLRHRLAEIGGDCEISASPGGGTRVRLKVALPAG